MIRKKGLAFAMLLLGLTTSCGYAPVPGNESADAKAVVASQQPLNKPAQQTTQQPLDQPVTVRGTVTLSHNDLFPVTGRSEYLNVVLVRGVYYEDWNPGPLMGSHWSGDFELQWTDDQGNRLATLDLTPLYTEPLDFGSFFQLFLGDYNGDGAPDFTIGQYGSSNGNFFKLFTLKPDYRIEELPVEGRTDLFITSADGRYSVPLEKEDDRSFRIHFYDNSIGDNVERLFRWDGSLFVGTEISDEQDGGNAT